MKILVIAGFVIPKAASLIGEQEVPFGGWVSSLLEGLSKIEGVELALVMKSNQKELITKKDGAINYYYLPTNAKNNLDVYIEDCSKVLALFKPDILHAEGAESFITNRFFSIFKGKKLISIKGVFYNVQEHEYGGLKLNDLILTFSLSKIIFGLTQFYTKNIRFRKRKFLERNSYELSQYVIGRTIYDNAHALSFNKNLKYFHNNENLRTVFYNKQWGLKKVEQFSLIIGNGYIARKGAHMVFHAVSILKEEFPTIKLYIVGTKAKSLKDKLTYKGYLNTLLTKYKIEKQVFFLGILNAEEMAESMKKKHVYILPSFVENSSNTLGEAMLMGMPSVVSYCGGVSSLAQDETDALFYRASDVAMLTHQIRRIFNNEIDVLALSNKAREKAINLYNRDKNTKRLIEIYNAIQIDNLELRASENY